MKISRVALAALILWFLTLTLGAALLNVVGALILLSMRESSTKGVVSPSPVINAIGPQAAAYAWPAWTPVPWPAVHQYSEYRDEFGVSRIQVYGVAATPTKPGPSLEMKRFGWPMPVIDLTQRWWDWNDPAMLPPGKTTQDFNGEMTSIAWAGLMVPPLVAGSLVWLLTAGVWLLVRKRRFGRNECEECGYPRGAGNVCTECGAALIA